MRKIKKLILAIKNIKIQGATDVCLATIEIAQLFAKKKHKLEIKEFLNEFKKFVTEVALTRATEPMAQNAIKYIIHNLKEKDPKSTKQAIELIDKYSQEFIRLLKLNKLKIIKNGAKIIKKNNKILTHCHSSSVEKILISSKSKKIKVYNTETRPLFQGRITAKKLTEAGINTTMLIDSTADFFISKHSGKDLTIDKVIIGCDSISWDGSIANKTGSYGIGLASKYNKVPFYIAGNLLKVDSDNIIHIEIRKDTEVWDRRNSKYFDIINFAFDHVPAEFITGIICEFGIIKPQDVKKIVLKNYPWLINK